jgi:hypothetical protein
VKGEGVLSSMWKTIRIYHPYAVVFSSNSSESKDTKIQKGLYLLTIQAMLMFIMALFCDFQVLCNLYCMLSCCHIMTTLAL